MEIYLHTENK